MEGTSVQTGPTGPSRSQLLALGRSALPHAPVRLPDESVSIRLAELLPGDADRLLRIYAFLVEIHDFLSPCLGHDDVIEGLAAQLKPAGFHRVHDDAGALGKGMRRRDAEPRLRKAYHDIRGGSLLAMLMHLELVEQGHATSEDATRAFILARDHLKIMRNAVSDLDPARRQADLEAKDHAVELLREKWSSVSYRLAQSGVSVELDCNFEGVIASCCMEFSTLDRVIYNLVNNAVTHAADGVVRLSVLPMDDQVETLVRVAVTNRVDPDQRRALQHRFGDDLGQVFRGGFSTASPDEDHGLGLRICGDLVAHGFSLPSVPFAVDHGYLGAKLIEDWFAVWFHWPARRPPQATAS